MALLIPGDRGGRAPFAVRIGTAAGKAARADCEKTEAVLGST